MDLLRSETYKGRLIETWKDKWGQEFTTIDKGNLAYWSASEAKRAINKQPLKYEPIAL